MFKCSKRDGIILVILLIFFGLVTLGTIHRDVVREMAIPKQSQNCPIDKRFKDERDRISNLLNLAKREYAIQSCQMLELRAKLGQKVNTAVSDSGGWCAEASSSKGGSHVMDRSLAEELSHFYNGKTVASFGDGPGDYKRYIDSTKRVAVYDAFDGAPFGNETSGGVIKFLDLTAPQYGLPMYDWVMSLEVAEHIPRKYELIYIDNVVRHAKEGIVLSWAVPGQRGLSHVNNRPLIHVINLLSERGFQHDLESSARLQKKASVSWLKRNTHVYRRRASRPPELDEA